GQRGSLPLACGVPGRLRRRPQCAVLRICLWIRARRRADRNDNPRQRADLGLKRSGDMAKVMGVDPALQEAGRHGKPGLAAAHRLEPDASEPAVENVLAQFRAQSLAAAPQRLCERRDARTAETDGVGIGFIIHVHGPVSVRMADSVGKSQRVRDALRLSPGSPPAFHPPMTLLWRQGSRGPSKPSETLKHGAQPAPVIAIAAWRERTPERQMKTSGAPRLTPAVSSTVESRATNLSSTCMDGNVCHSRKSAVLPRE